MSFVESECAFDQYVCELVSGVDIFDLDLRVKVNPVNQPMEVNAMSSGNMSHCRARAIDDHLDHCIVVLKNQQTC